MCISLSIIPLLKKELHEIKEACIAKNITLDTKNMKIILSKFIINILSKTNEIEESLISKGYGNY